ncbi:MAG: nicotinamidase [Deltaproteobacteria bacterium]|nr:MAG: nicotinamidase [Deltaproteobacteria bacterium]
MRIAPTDALVVVDLQPDFMPGGALPVPEGDAVVPVVAPLLRRFATVVATQDWHPPGHASFASSHPGRRPYDIIERFGHPQVLWPDHCVQGTAGAALVVDLPTEPVSLVLRKGMDPEVDSYSAFRENYGPGGMRAPTGLAGYLRERGIRRVFVCGLARDFCVRWTAEDAAAAGFETFVLDDATRPVFPDAREETDRAFADAGVHVVRTSDLTR